MQTSTIPHHNTAFHRTTMFDSDNDNDYNAHILLTIQSAGDNDNLNYITLPVNLDNSKPETHTRECPMYLWAGLVMRPSEIPSNIQIPLLFFPLSHRVVENGYALFHSLLKLVSAQPPIISNPCEPSLEGVQSNTEITILSKDNSDHPTTTTTTLKPPPPPKHFSFNQTITLNIPFSSEGDYLINPRRDKGPIPPSFSYTILQWIVIHQYYQHVEMIVPSEPIPHYLLDHFSFPPDRFEFESPLRESDLEDPWDLYLWDRFGDHRFYCEAEESELLIDAMELMIEGYIDSILNDTVDEYHPDIEHEFDFWAWA